MRRKEQITLSAEAPDYFSAQRIASSLVGIASAIPRGDKEDYCIPEYLDIRSIRNAIARQSLNEGCERDFVHLETASNIARWLMDKTSEQ